MSAPIVADLRRCANGASSLADRLGSSAPPGHCNYISKAGASACCADLAARLECHRDVVVQLLEALEIARGYIEYAMAEPEDIAFIDSAIAKAGGAE